jgi:hypothetical protein
MSKKKYIESADDLWSFFDAYRSFIKVNPIKTVEQKKGTVILGKGYEGDAGDLNTVELPHQRPLTLDGFENYVADLGIINDLGDYFSNKDGKYSDYSTICKRIKRVIRQDQIEGGMAGIYNPSITQRLNGLTEKIQEDGSKEMTIKVKYERKGNNPE